MAFKIWECLDWRLIVALAGALATMVSAYVVWKWDCQNLQEFPISADAFPPDDSADAKPLLKEESLASEVPQTDFGNLASDVDADYTKLRDLLAAENYQAADLETRKVMVWVCRAVKQAESHPQDSLPFPCKDLQTINRLWVYYSEGRFGFSVQKQIYLAVDRDYEQFGDRVGWRADGEWVNYHYLQFDRSAPQGHLPRITWVLVGGYEGWKPALLVKRCFDCDL